MGQPIYKKGQLLINNSTGREVIVKLPNIRRLLVKRGIRSTGFSEEFTGTYFCSWLNDKNKWEDGDIDENLLSKP